MRRIGNSSSITAADHVRLCELSPFEVAAAIAVATEQEAPRRLPGFYGRKLKR
jgi:hypothetical protein